MTRNKAAGQIVICSGWELAGCKETTIKKRVSGKKPASKGGEFTGTVETGL